MRSFAYAQDGRIHAPNKKPGTIRA